MQGFAGTFAQDGVAVIGIDAVLSNGQPPGTDGRRSMKFEMNRFNLSTLFGMESRLCIPT